MALLNGSDSLTRFVPSQRRQTSGQGGLRLCGNISLHDVAPKGVASTVYRASGVASRRKASWPRNSSWERSAPARPGPTGQCRCAFARRRQGGRSLEAYAVALGAGPRARDTPRHLVSLTGRAAPRSDCAARAHRQLWLGSALRLRRDRGAAAGRGTPLGGDHDRGRAGLRCAGWNAAQLARDVDRRHPRVQPGARAG